MASLERVAEDIYLIGRIDSQIRGNKFPSRLQVLKVLFFNMRIAKLTLLESASLVVKEVKIFWAKAQIPTHRKDVCITKVKNLYEGWRALQKSAGKFHNLEREKQFLSEHDNLFDIAHAKVNDMIDDERRKFLSNQREEGRTGYIANFCTVYDDISNDAQNQEDRENSSRTRKRKREEKSQFTQVSSSPGSSILLASQESAQSNASAKSDRTYIPSDEEPCEPRTIRGTTNIMTDKLVAVLDKCKVSDRNAVHLIIAVAQALNIEVDALIINRTSIRLSREKGREAKAALLKEVFKNTELNASVLHWDGKLIRNLVEHKVTDRLPVLISDGNIEQLLGVPELESGTGLSQAKAIFELLDDWGISHKIKALCCDTTASNLGSVNGAAVKVEQLLERDILYFPCRHHIYELILRSVFEQKMPQVCGPNVPLFKRFQDAWQDLDKNNYTVGLADNNIRVILGNHLEDVISFVNEMLEVNHPRNDYKEFLILTKIFCGVIPVHEVKFKHPGAFHHARWMSKAIYCLKIFLFRSEFKLTASERKALSDICIFIVMIYVEAWFTAPLATQAPNHDLEFLKKLYNYKSIDQKVSQATVNKFQNHLWYLNPQTAAMSFFDQKLSDDIKNKMVAQTKICQETESYETDCKKISIHSQDIEDLQEREIDHFISSQSLKFFERFEIETNFMQKDSAMWNQDENYLKGLKIVKELKVVNDTAERAVSLVEGYVNILSRDDKQKQFLMQVLSYYRKQYPDSSKHTVMKEFN